MLKRLNSQTTLIEQLRNLPNRGDLHVFLGHPLSDADDKTTIEPGNSFSPGVWTCGISTAVLYNDKLYCPETMNAAELAWHFGVRPGGAPPILSSAFSAGAVRLNSRLAHLGGEGVKGADFCVIELRASQAANIAVMIVVRESGPAGGVISALEWRAECGELLINKKIRLRPENRPDHIRVFHGDGKPAAALLIYEFALTPAQLQTVSFVVEHDGGNGKTSNRHAGAISAKQGLTAAEADWARACPARIFAPDPIIASVWERCAFHILAAMETGLPRIGTVNYPVFWMRDCVIVLRALDLLGRSDLARIGCDYLAPLLHSGGFGAESDGPGEGLWALVAHARMSHDREWLAGIHPHLKTRAELLVRMRNATQTLRAMTENRMPKYIHHPNVNVLCFPAQNGLIHGRIDWHSPDFYINCWAVAGLRAAVEAAEIIGKADDATAWAEEAGDWETALRRHLLPKYGNARDPIVTPWPTEALATGLFREELINQFAAWFRSNRLDEAGHRRPEPLWTYFKAAQIHNALLLGLNDEAWTCLRGMLGEGLSAGFDVSAFIEGPAQGNECLPFRNDNDGKARGWLRPEAALGGNMPHNWTSAEMIALLRDVFVVETDDGLVLGQGVPQAWLKPGARFGVKNLPTERGRVSYEATVKAAGQVALHYEGPTPYRCAWSKQVPTIR
jgi:hypothetical protein